MADRAARPRVHPLPVTLNLPVGIELDAHYLRLWSQEPAPNVEQFLTQFGVTDLEDIVRVLRVDQSERDKRGEWVAAEA